MKPALLLVDVQQDYLVRPGLTPAAPVIEEALASLLAAARANGWPVFHIRTRVAADGADAMPHWRAAARLLCVDGTEGVEPPAALRAVDGEFEFDKRFFSPFENSALLPALQRANVTQIIIAGLYTHACVRCAATDAYAHGFEVFIPTGAVASYDPQHAALTLDWLHGRVANCLPMQDLLVLLGTP
jgi:aldehyde dehydrogenase (NAD+)